MKLTIGMIVKNEERWLEKCLTAIKPILDNVDSELIITDTGSDDRTVEIAEKFADKVLHFEWIKDFSAARNTAINIAQGEWFMYLDADEIFSSCDDVIRFFNSGKYKQYNSASIVIRSIFDENNNDYSVFNASRLTKLTPHTKFVGEIHENLNTFNYPVMKLNDIVDHYGYIASDKEKLANKFKRNYELLLKKYNDKTNFNPLVFPQLYDCCRMGNLNDEAESYLEEGITWTKEHNDGILIVLYCKKAVAKSANEEYQAAIDVCDDFFAMDKKIRPGIIMSDVEILAIKGLAQYNMNNYDEAEKTLCSFFDVFEKFKSGKILSNDALIFDQVASTDSNFVKNLCCYLNCVIKGNNHDYRKAIGIISVQPIYKYSDDHAWVDRLVELELIILEKVGYAESAACFRQLDSYGKEVFVKMLNQALYYSNNKETAARALMELSDDAYIKSKADIIERNYSGKDLKNDRLVDFAKQYGISGNADILMIAMEGGYDISGMIAGEDFDPEKCAEQGYKCFYGFNKAMDTYDINMISDPTALINVAKLYECSMKYTVDFKSPKPKVYVILNADRLVYKFGQIGERIKDELPEYDSSDPVINAAAIMGDAIKSLREKDYKACMEAMKQAVEVYRNMARFVSDFSKAVVDEYNEYVKSKQQGMTEMERLALTIKTNIRSFIAGGNIAAAQKTLNEYRSIAPNDPDIGSLQSEIDARS